MAALLWLLVQGCVCVMLGSLGLGAMPKGCLGRVHGWHVQAMPQGVPSTWGEA